MGLGHKKRELPEYRPFPRETGRDASHGDFELPLMARVLGLPRGQRVLEIGCGVGAGLPALMRLLAPRRLVGIDIDPVALEAARTRLDREGTQVEVVLADVRDLPFEDASFDLVCDFGTCYHIARPERALAEVSRVLAPGGRFVGETRLNQMTSHPVRAWGRRLPWSAAPALAPARETLMWYARERVS